ncbi:Inositol-1-monophosphatase [uncultured Desulfobacterium sp.]|uniref:Inositol-1-monophosphatase n=1 Tax=uncultured Desulfobacterium sp. TaxID=201089 RepID=A0A445N2L2_9BACT|nr:Inositol-1-monophosphatase [uncultured Desulfobacterium sp.]
MLEKELNIARKAAQSGGKILADLFGQVKQITKKGDIDLVTEADLNSEKEIIRIIHDNFPDDNILSEEGGELGRMTNRTWIIDPLDGTTNFVHGFPFFAVSIGLEIEQEIALGVVFNPYLGELFEAVKGSGAFFNNSTIHVSHTPTLAESLLATGFPYNIQKESGNVIRLFEKMLVLSQGVRRPGSAAIDMCYVAAGRFDGFWEQNLKPWDTAAGTIIVKEAGGTLSDYTGAPYNPYMHSVVAANPYIHDMMISVLS